LARERNVGLQTVTHGHKIPSERVVMAPRFFQQSCCWLLIIVLCPALSSCSSSDSHTGYPQALRAVEDAISAPTAEWADAVAKSFQTQLDSAGEIAPDKTLEVAASKADAVISAGCDAIAKQKNALKKEVDVPGLPRLSDFPRIRLAQAMGHFPQQIYATKPIWPDDWLLTPGAQPDYTAPLTAVDREFFKRYLKAELLGPDGSVVFPMAGTPQYSNFKGLLYDSKGLLGNRVGYQSSPIDRGFEKCSPAS